MTFPGGEWYCNSDSFQGVFPCTGSGLASVTGPQLVSLNQVDLTSQLYPGSIPCTISLPCPRGHPSMRSSVLSSRGHILLIGFFGDFFMAFCSHPLMDPRARDVSWAKHRLLGASWMDSSLCLCALACVFHGLSLSRKKWKWRVVPLQRKPDESNALCLGEHCDRLWLDTDDTTQREPERPFHSLSCETKQAHSIRFIWVGHLFQPFFIGWCVDCLFCKCH